MLEVNIFSIFGSSHFINQPLDLWTLQKSIVNPTNLMVNLLNFIKKNNNKPNIKNLLTTSIPLTPIKTKLKTSLTKGSNFH
jgi:hypothetical protein